MITIDIKKEKHTIEELLAMASSGPLLIYDKNGHHYILEEADDFEKEAQKLGRSRKFMKFLENRSGEEETFSVAEIAKKLGNKEKS